MKKFLTTIISTLMCSYLNFSFGQEFGSKDTISISFLTDVNFSSSADDNRKEASSGIGTIGLKYEKGYVYGNTSFTVYSQNKSIVSDTSEIKIFGSNLLLPENSSSKVSNFSILLGLKTFYLNSEKLEANTFSLKRFGANIEFKVNNNIWKNDSLTSSITINTFNANLNYMLLNAKILNTNERIKLIVSYGLTTRRLGGDFGLNSNNRLRKDFLGTDVRGFNGSNIGVRLEISKFYGEMNLTHFNNKYNISGFSGDQAIITIGLIADLTLVAKDLGLVKQ